MQKHRTPSLSLGQLAKIAGQMTTALPKALEGADPKEAVRRMTSHGEAFGRYVGMFFRPEADDQNKLRPRSILALEEVPVDYTCSLEQAILRAVPEVNPSEIEIARKIYDEDAWTSPQRVVLTDITLVGFDDWSTDVEAIVFGNQWGFARPLNIREALAVLQRYPHPQLYDTPGILLAMAFICMKEYVFEDRRHEEKYQMVVHLSEDGYSLNINNSRGGGQCDEYGLYGYMTKQHP